MQVTFTDEILILTPICNSETLLRHYFENLCSLAYPHRLISVVLGEDSSNDKTLQVNCSRLVIVVVVVVVVVMVVMVIVTLAALMSHIKQWRGSVQTIDMVQTIV